MLLRARCFIGRFAASHAPAVYCSVVQRMLSAGAVNMCCFKQATSGQIHLNDSAETPEPIQIADTAEALKQLIRQHDNPASLLELYYWSKEPGLLECLRAFLQAPAEVRNILQTLLPAAVASDKLSSG